MTEIVGVLPPGIAEVVARHGQLAATGDQDGVLADFRPDRVGQLAGSAVLPARLVGSEVMRLVSEPDSTVTAIIRYTGADGEQVRLRSRWVHLSDGWRVHQVRNLPVTPPRLPCDGGGEDGLDAPHWAGLGQGELRIQRCSDCAHWIWAPRPICPACHGFELDWAAVEPAGTVFSWTRTWQPFVPQLTGHLPFTTVLVELPEAGNRRVLGVLDDPEESDIAAGTAVVGEFDTTGEPLLRWRLR